MKSMWIINCFFILFLMAVISSCVRDPVIPPPDVTYRGGLAFLVEDDLHNPVQGVTISISLSQEDLRNQVYLATEYSDTAGIADFGERNAGFYWYRAVLIDDDITFHLEGVVEVEAGKNVTLKLDM